MFIISFQTNVLFLYSPKTSACLEKTEIEHWLKVGLSPSKKKIIICFNDNPSKMMKNAFHLESSFRSQDI